MEDITLQNARSILGEVAEWAKLSQQGVSIAKFGGFDADGHFMVELADHLETVRALSTVGLSESEAGIKVVVAFEKGNVRSPVIIGRLQQPGLPSSSVNAKVDGDRVVLKADREIELRCGEASIVLTRAGKILIRGNYVLSRSRGANKIKGAYVDIN